MDTYDGDFNRLRQAFVEFLAQLPFYGLAVLCIEDPELRDIARDLPRPVLTYGLSEDADVRAANIRQEGVRTHFDIQRKGSEGHIAVTLNMPGIHNVLNALAAVAVASELGVDDGAIGRALSTFQGIGRRFQVYGDVETPVGSILFVDDYGHHPSEMQATLRAVRTGWPDRRLVLAFQPHRYSRTRDLFEDLAQVLSEVDVLLLLEVYSAGEQPIPGADGRTLSRAIRARGQVDPVFVRTIGDLPLALTRVLQDGDVLLTMGAGNVGSVAGQLAATCLGFDQVGEE